MYVDIVKTGIVSTEWKESLLLSIFENEETVFIELKGGIRQTESPSLSLFSRSDIFEVENWQPNTLIELVMRFYYQTQTTIQAVKPQEGMSASMKPYRETNPTEIKMKVHKYSKTNPSNRDDDKNISKKAKVKNLQYWNKNFKNNKMHIIKRQITKVNNLL